MIKVFPTMIDSYRYFLNNETMSFKEIIARINREPRPTTEPMLKGKAFNNLIDRLTKGDIPRTYRSYKDGIAQDVYVVEEEEKELQFNRELSDRIAMTLDGGLSQIYTECVVMTDYGPVKLYGYADYVVRDVVYELKTSRHYSFFSYMENAQHKYYMLTLRKNGVRVNRGVYLITDFLQIYREEYEWRDNMEGEIISSVSAFLDFVHRHKAHITNKDLLKQERHD